MSVEYHTGYCKNCDADRKLERKTPNHILHFLITVVLGIFTYGIGSVVWIVVWYLISSKFSGWTCHVCGSENDEPIFHHTEHGSKHEDINRIKVRPKIIDKLKDSYKIIIGLVISFVIIMFLFSLDFNENKNGNNNENKKENTKNNESEDKIVNATVNINEKDNEKKKINLKYNEVESSLCYIYDLEYESNSVNGSVSCKQGQLTVNFYDSESKSIVETKTVTFKDNKFYIKFENFEKRDFKLAIKLTKKQIEARLKELKEEKSQSLPSIKSYDNETNSQEKDTNIDKCSIENWKYTKDSAEYIIIEGKTTCKNGQIILQIYDENNNNLGKESAYIKSGGFKVFLKTTSNPTRINLNYTISQK